MPLGLARCLVNAPDVQDPGYPGPVSGVAGVVATASAFELTGAAGAAPAFLPDSGAELADGPAQRPGEALRGKRPPGHGPGGGRRAVSWRRGSARDPRRRLRRPGRSGAAAPGRPR